MVETQNFDVVFAGGGLSSGLTAYRLAQSRPELSIAIIERGQTLGGNHTWSFHDADLTPAQLKWMAPFVSCHWPSQSVAFPRRSRSIDAGYNSIFADQLDKVLRDVPQISVLSGTPVADAGPTSVTLDDGSNLTAKAVFDGRGPVATPDLFLGFQKFLGLELEFSEPHGLAEPIIMDATVPQTDGYRFVYVLPFSPTTALIEDTYFADGHDLPRETLRTEISRYAAQKGWHIKETIREEAGVLPIVLDGNISAYWQRLRGGPAPIGLRAGLVHPVTGYSVSEAVRLADLISDLPLDPQTAFAAIEAHSKKRWAQHQFYRALNRMLFRAAKPDQRYIVLQRFYGLPQGLIERFYAGDNTFADKIRILAGKPPVPIGAAIKALPASGRGRMIEEGLLG